MTKKLDIDSRQIYEGQADLYEFEDKPGRRDFLPIIINREKSLLPTFKAPVKDIKDGGEENFARDPIEFVKREVDRIRSKQNKQPTRSKIFDLDKLS